MGISKEVILLFRENLGIILTKLNNSIKIKLYDFLIVALGRMNKQISGDSGFSNILILFDIFNLLKIAFKNAEWIKLDFQILLKFKISFFDVFFDQFIPLLLDRKDSINKRSSYIMLYYFFKSFFKIDIKIFLF